MTLSIKVMSGQDKMLAYEQLIIATRCNKQHNVLI